MLLAPSSQASPIFDVSTQVVGEAIQVIDGHVCLTGSFDLRDANDIFSALSKARPLTGELTIDLSPLGRIDKVAVAALVAACRAHVNRGVAIKTSGQASIGQLIERALASPTPSEDPTPSLLEVIGQGTLGQLSSTRALLSMTAASVMGIARVAVRRVRLPRNALSDKIATMGADAVGIVVILSILLGMILAFEATRQLGPLGAKPLIPDVVGLSLIREFAPFLCAIVVIARNGAAIASELASMRAGQEVDALRTMGIDPVDYLVVPRTLSLLITSPVLTLLSMFVGLAGATAVAIEFAQLDVALFYYRLIEAVGFGDVAFGIGKSLAFAATTSLTASAIGLSAGSSASDVGRATTHAVVLGIFLVVITDAIFSFFSGVAGG